MKDEGSRTSWMKWYHWVLVPVAMPGALVVLVPLGIVGILSIPYFWLFPDHHFHIVDRCGTPRQRRLLASWRLKYKKLGIIGRIGVAIKGGRRRHPAYVREIKIA